MADNPYESDDLLSQYLVFHYASPEDQFPYGFGGMDGLDFPTRCVAEGLDLRKLPTQHRALDIGCAVGRSTFELARTFHETIGIDYSHNFIHAGNRLKEAGQLPTRLKLVGDSSRELKVNRPEGIDSSRVHFEQGDAQNLRDGLGTFDAILACNLICRLPDPQKFLARLPSLLNPGGQLFLTTPFTWLEEYTPKENWLGSGGSSSFDALHMALEPHFRLDAEFNMPFLIPETARKFQYTIAQASRWIRKHGP